MPLDLENLYAFSVNIKCIHKRDEAAFTIDLKWRAFDTTVDEWSNTIHCLTSFYEHTFQPNHDREGSNELITELHLRIRDYVKQQSKAYLQNSCVMLAVGDYTQHTIKQIMNATITAIDDHHRRRRCADAITKMEFKHTRDSMYETKECSDFRDIGQIDKTNTSFVNQRDTEQIYNWMLETFDYYPNDESFDFLILSSDFYHKIATDMNNDSI